MNSEVVALLCSKKLKVAFAESCTGGSLAKLITDVDGSSSCFECGVVSYSNRIKQKILDVSENTLKTYGAVSSECAEEMARGILNISGADIGISVTGIAGPSGGSEQKPVGTVFIALAVHNKLTVIKHDFSQYKYREKIREQTCLAALKMLKEELLGT